MSRRLQGFLRFNVGASALTLTILSLPSLKSIFNIGVLKTLLQFGQEMALGSIGERERSGRLIFSSSKEYVAASNSVRIACNFRRTSLVRMIRNDKNLLSLFKMPTQQHPRNYSGIYFHTSFLEELSILDLPWYQLACNLFLCERNYL
jgi:hypothetical protein